MRMCQILLLLVASTCLAGPPAGTNAKMTPGGMNHASSLFVFGPGGQDIGGQDDSIQVIFIRVPATSTSQVVLRIFDAGSDSALDRTHYKWGEQGAVTEFSVYGGAGAYSAAESHAKRPDWQQTGTQLAAREFSDEGHGAWTEFGKYDMASGERVGSHVYFKVVALARSGDRPNFFRYGVLPGTAEVFTYNLALHTDAKRGQVMSFDVEVPARETLIVENNFDLDKSGHLFMATEGAVRKLATSRTGLWITNALTIPVATTDRRYRYDLVRGKQRHGNGRLFFTDSTGNALKTFLDFSLPQPD